MIMHNDWDQLFDQEIQKDYLLKMCIRDRYQSEYTNIEQQLLEGSLDLG